MAALSDSQRRESKGKGSIEFLQTNSTTLYDGSFVSVDTTAGTIIPHDDTAGNSFLGVYTGAASTGASGTTYAPVSTERKILVQQTVTGVSAQTDIGAPIYITTDNDMTLTRPSDDATCIGFVIRWYSSTTCDVMLFDPVDSFLYAMNGRGKQTICLGSFALAGFATGNAVTGFKLWGKGKITNFYVIADDDVASGSSGDIDLNLEIGGTNVTNSQISVLEAGIATVGDKLEVDSAISALNTFYDGDLLDVEAVVNTAYTGGFIGLYIEVEYLF